jgi:GntR family transcriptional regulator, rspAB operon transcriptional repressor
MARRVITAPAPLADEGRLPPLVLQIADQLMQDIVSGRYVLGEPIREQEIADRMGASRGPVREALRLCQQDGLVEILPWRGARVVNLGIDETDDLFEVLSALMGVVARLAAIHATDEGIEQFAAAVQRLDQIVAERRDTAAQLAMAFEAGAILRRICGSERAGEFLVRIGRLAYLQHRFVLDASLSWRRQTVRKHQLLLETLRNRDPARAERAARAVVAQSQAYVIARMRQGYRSERRVLGLAPFPRLMARTES